MAQSSHPTMYVCLDDWIRVIIIPCGDIGGIAVNHIIVCACGPQCSMIYRETASNRISYRVKPSESPSVILNMGMKEIELYPKIRIENSNSYNMWQERDAHAHAPLWSHYFGVSGEMEPMRGMGATRDIRNGFEFQSPAGSITADLSTLNLGHFSEDSRMLIQRKIAMLTPGASCRAPQN